MSTDLPQEQDDDVDQPERVEVARDVAAAQEAERQYDDLDEPERVEVERDGAAAQEAERQHDDLDQPERVEVERDGVAAQEAKRQHDDLDQPERVEVERDGVAAQEAERPATIPTAPPVGEEVEPELTAGEQVTVLEDRDAGVSPIPPARPSLAQADFQVFGPGELEGYRLRWESIQLGFLDDPKGAAEEADTVVGELLGHLTERRQALRDELNRQPDQDVDTESMRLAVRNYRALFRRLVGS